MESAAKIAGTDKNMVKEKLNELPDDLLLKILSKLPFFKESVARSLISKRHEEPWKLVLDVTFKDDNEESRATYMNFIYVSFLFDGTQTLERLHLKLVRNYSASDINIWVQVAVDISVRKLRFDVYWGTLKLPRCLNNSTTLKSLILREVTISHIPFGFCLPSLKSLHLFSVRFSQKASIKRLLQSCPDLEYLVINQAKYLDVWNFGGPRVCLSSLKSLHLLLATNYDSSRDSLTLLLQSCPVLEYLVVRETDRFSIIWDLPPESCLSSIKSLHLSSVKLLNDESIATLFERCAALEDLVINRTRDDNVRVYNINVPTLKSLTINNTREKHTDDDNKVKENHGFLINSSALETLNIKDTVSNFLILEFMPEVTKANIEVICDKSESFIGSLTSIQHLSLCSPTSETPYRRGSVFPYLEHLELCTCSPGWANLLASILNNAPRLQSLKLKSNHSPPRNDPNNFWNEPAVVPESLLKHLEIFEWRQYEDTVQHWKMAAYILANATCLKMASFSTRCRDNHHGMLMQIKQPNRVSETCQLVFE
ncbi:unnamed protein product [Eruca vesicaria subsp. sativa]|uniref:FBD domain-containing protein n=1 Tax=Eruca vesicaria subsp. sativa TaxID=29727 RepID=A0ABC8JIH1_ERUVS|nr:unnamed protein product [Eruca vesicaria subsp. sativa]